MANSASPIFDRPDARLVVLDGRSVGSAVHDAVDGSDWPAGLLSQTRYADGDTRAALFPGGAG